MSNDRDDFSEETKRRLGERVNLQCSTPECRAPTKGPHTDDSKASNVGVAAHIHGASKNGPRYRVEQTSEQRKSIENGIWLCRICDKKVDGDEARYPAELLRAWKVMAEHAADQQLGKPRDTATTSSSELAYLRLLLHEVEHVRDRSKEDSFFLSRGPLAVPPRYQYKPIGDAVHRVPIVLEDGSLRSHIKSLRDALEELERGASSRSRRS